MLRRYPYDFEATAAGRCRIGGSVPTGYASVNKKLVLVPEETETVPLPPQRWPASAPRCSQRAAAGGSV
jgi:hypothetical protein